MEGAKVAGVGTYDHYFQNVGHMRGCVVRDEKLRLTSRCRKSNVVVMIKITSVIWAANWDAESTTSPLVRFGLISFFRMYMHNLVCGCWWLTIREFILTSWNQHNNKFHGIFFGAELILTMLIPSGFFVSHEGDTWSLPTHQGSQVIASADPHTSTTLCSVNCVDGNVKVMHIAL